MAMQIGFAADKTRDYRRASVLALITIIYNIVEGIVSVSFGLEDETFALFGFGLDSFVEVASGVGIWHMIRRIRQNDSERPDEFERTALRVTGTGFYLLTAGLGAAAIANFVQGHRPETTLWGIVVSIVSIMAMWFLIRAKVRVGKALNSAAILADAACTRACLHLSIVLLVSSVGYELSGIGGVDALGTIMIAWFCFREGKESFGQAKVGNYICTCGSACQSREKA